MSDNQRMAKKKRGYSRAFTPRSTKRVRFDIDRVPPTLAARVRAKCKRTSTSVRAIVLALLTDWVSQDDTHDPPTS